MRKLWDLSHIQPETQVVLEGDTIPAMFWNGVLRYASSQKDEATAQRAYDVLMKRKEAPARQKEAWQKLLDDAKAK